MKLWLRISNMFRKKPVYETAAVRLDKLEKWIELQYKPLLSPTHKQLETNFQILSQTISELEKASLALSQALFSEEKVHVHSLTVEHRKILINLVHALTQYNKVVATDFMSLREHYAGMDKYIKNINEFLPRAQKTLLIMAPEKTQAIIDLVAAAEVNYKQALDIFDDEANQAYISLQKSLQSLLAKRERKEELLLAIEKKKVDLQNTKMEAKKYELKVRDIQHDSRYRHEKVAMRDANTKYRVSYYELDLQDNVARLERMEQKIALIQSDIDALNESVKNLNIEAERQILVSKMKKRLGIEVEIVE
ncbi:MAG TPA: hypothetical protein VK158_03640 [Acidobacteriota bacterium]|nr:hypothetical protein [Acidobacteriota bacterium]